MHVALYSPAWPTAGSANGTVTYVDALSRELLAAGHEVTIVTLNGIHPARAEEPRTVDVGGVRHASLTLWDRYTEDTASAAHRLKVLFADLHRRHPIDVIEMEESFGWFEEVARLGVPLVTRLHGPEFRAPHWEDPGVRTKRSAIRERREGKAIASARAVTAPTAATLDATLSRYGAAAALHRVIPNPVRLPDAEVDRSAADPNLLFWVGSFMFLKGPDILLQAFDRLAATHPHLRLEMAGADIGLVDGANGLMHFEDYCRASISPAARERIVFHGVISPERLLERRKAAGLAVISSRSETFSYAATESMALGLPVLATRWDGSEEVIRDGETGWLVDPESPAALAAGIAEALAAPHEMARRGASAALYCRDHYAPAIVARQTLAFYEDLIADAAKSPAKARRAR